ncbi:MAG: hypothetical protein KUG82_18085 [Pseudomonadales bacterium]|nr:hypothetical protein [Pseudomonadales bacterium]
MKRFIYVMVLSSISLMTFAETSGSYAGQENREIKALSQQNVADYLQGKGLGYAKAAELNHYPGPKHVLEVAARLNLTREQVDQTQILFDTMKSEASKLGKHYIEKEQLLDKLFASGTLSADFLKSILSEIGALKAQIRYVHLNAHLEQKTLLTAYQINLYDQLRGYGNASHDHHHSHTH